METRPLDTLCALVKSQSTEVDTNSTVDTHTHTAIYDDKPQTAPTTGLATATKTGQLNVKNENENENDYGDDEMPSKVVWQTN